MSDHLLSSFELLARKYPHHIAVISSQHVLSYGDLSQYAHFTAEQILEYPKPSSGLVAIIMKKGWEELVAVLAILKAGLAYVPINANESEAWIQSLLVRTEVTTVLTQSSVTSLIKWPKAMKIIEIESKKVQQAQKVKPTAQDINYNHQLAYVIFTSGSTGLPKGVMTAHKAVINTIDAINKQFDVQYNDGVLALSELNFDLSVYDIFGLLSVGGTVVIPEQQHIKDPHHWIELMIQHRVTIWNTVPAFMEMLVHCILSDCRLLEKVRRQSHLRLVLLSGDWIPLNLPEKIHLVFGKININSLGGATEAAIWSILYPIKQVDPQWTSIPYGKPLKNQNFHILDESLEPIEQGKAGELFISGQGVALGYWKNPEKTQKHFIVHPKLGLYMYRTGDMGAYLPDGNIQFLGRVDQQVKVNGFRVELGCIEQCLMKHPYIQSCVATTRSDSLAKQLVTFLVLEPLDKLLTQHSNLADELESRHIDYWEMVYASLSYAVNQWPDSQFNITGWKNSYTNKPFSCQVMHEWVDSTLECIQSLQPQRILELGCGTGLLLFQLAPNAVQYTATDISSTILDYLRKHTEYCIKTPIQFIKNRSSKLDFMEPCSVDTVVINSISQYLPSLDYLKSLLEHAVQVTQAGGHIFIGDVKHFGLIYDFYAQVQLHTQKKTFSYMEWHEAIQRRALSELELFIHPEFFQEFADSHPRVSHVEITLRKGSAHNEMNSFRYNIILSIEQSVEHDSPVQEMDWRKKPHTLKEIVALAHHAEQPLIIRHIPNQRFINFTAIDHLFAQLGYSLDAQKTTEQLAPLHTQAIDPEQLHQLATSEKFRMSTTWDSQNPQCFDVAFYLSSFKNPFRRICKTKLHTIMDDSSWSNHPLNVTLQHLMREKLPKFLKRRLAHYMIPRRFNFLDQMPWSANGKIDRKPLNMLSQNTYSSSAYSPAVTPIQEKLVDIWEEVLGMGPTWNPRQFYRIGWRFFNGCKSHIINAKMSRHTFVCD